MRLDSRHARLNLAKRQLARLAHDGGVCMQCVGGSAWITVDGDRRDIVLDRGDSFLVESGADVIVYALEDATEVELHARRAPQPAGWRAWMRSALAGAA